MTVNARQAHRLFAKAVREAGGPAVAAGLACSVTQVLSIAKGRRRPGLRIAFAIEDAYKIPARAWLR